MSPAAGAHAMPQPAGAEASDQRPAGSPFTARSGGANPPAASQAPPVQHAARGGTGWRPAGDHAATHFSLKGRDLKQRVTVPKWVVAISFSNTGSIPSRVPLYLLVSGVRVKTVERRQQETAPWQTWC